MMLEFKTEPKAIDEDEIIYYYVFFSPTTEH
jgi:hypothetical protein